MKVEMSADRLARCWAVEMVQRSVARKADRSARTRAALTALRLGAPTAAERDSQKVWPTVYPWVDYSVAVMVDLMAGKTVDEMAA